MMLLLRITKVFQRMCAYSKARLREGTSSRLLLLLLSGGSSMPGRVSQLSSLVHLSFSSPESDAHEADHSPSLNSELLLRTQSRIHAQTHVSPPRKSQSNPLSWRALACRMSTHWAHLWHLTHFLLFPECIPKAFTVIAQAHPWLQLGGFF